MVNGIRSSLFLSTTAADRVKCLCRRTFSLSQTEYSVGPATRVSSVVTTQKDEECDFRESEGRAERLIFERCAIREGNSMLFEIPL